MGAPYRVALVPGEPNRTTTPAVGFAWGGLKMPRQWCFHVGCGFSCVQGRTKGRGSQNLGTGNLAPTAEGHPVGVSGRSWAHFDGNWCGLDAGTTKDCARVDPGGRRPQTRGHWPTVKLAIWQRQNLYLEHIGSDRRIFSQDPHPMSCKMSRRGPSYVPAIKICMAFDLLIMGVCGVSGA